MKPLLSFISDEMLEKHINLVLFTMEKANEKVIENPFSNEVDPFSAILDAMYQDITLKEWFDLELRRKIQKTFQNAIGEFHQHILGSINGWEDLGTGSVIDIVNEEKKIIAEIKNKHNTTKGNHKVMIYDDFKKLLNNKYKGYTGYYVEIIPKSKKKYNEPFTPSDNNTSKRRSINKNIRRIDGYSFYELASDKEKALELLYKAIPIVAGKYLKKDKSKILKEELFDSLFKRIY